MVWNGSDLQGDPLLPDPPAPPPPPVSPYEKLPDPPPLEDKFPPILTQQWTTAPNLPDKKIEKAAGGDNKPEPPVPHPAWIVSPGSLRDCETGLIAEVSTQITDYMALRDEVERVKGTIFRARVPPDWVKIAFAHQEAYQEIEIGKLKEIGGDPYKGHAGASAEESEKNGNMLENALLSAANSIYLVGELTQLLNDAAQGYVIADVNARLPDAPQI
jgi:hypothetical protein